MGNLPFKAGYVGGKHAIIITCKISSDLSKGRKTK